MAAAPLYEYEPIGSDPDDPAEILRVLPREHHGQFLSEYQTALAVARDVEHYRDLHVLLRSWRLLAEAMSRPGFRTRQCSLQARILPSGTRFSATGSG